MFERILESRVRPQMERMPESSQRGFRKGHCISDHLFSLRQIMDRTIKLNKKVYICFIDLKKAFDMVPR